MVRLLCIHHLLCLSRCRLIASRAGARLRKKGADCAHGIVYRKGGVGANTNPFDKLRAGCPAFFTLTDGGGRRMQGGVLSLPKAPVGFGLRWDNGEAHLPGGFATATSPEDKLQKRNQL